MKQYEYTITFSKAVSAGRSAERKFNKQVHAVIPGGTIRGALANTWWRTQADLVEAGTPQAAFETLFDQNLIVGQAVPEGFSLITASTVVCKYLRENGCREFAHDAAHEATSVTECPRCKGPLTGRTGWHDKGNRTQIGRFASTVMTERETAADGKLYSRDALRSADREALVCRGVLTVRDPLIDLSWLRDGIPVRVGGKRSSELGAGRLTLSEGPVPVDLPDAPKHALVATSPLILLDDFGGPALDIDGIQLALQRQLGIAVSVETRPGWLRTVPIEGFHMRSALPKRREWALDAGSVFLVHGLTADQWETLQGGLGYRTLEGFGSLGLADSAHALVIWDQFIQEIKGPQLDRLRREAFAALDQDDPTHIENFARGREHLERLFALLDRAERKDFQGRVQRAKDAADRASKALRQEKRAQQQAEKARRRAERKNK